MKKLFKYAFYLFLLVFPFLIVVAVNESQRGKNSQKPNFEANVPTLNGAEKDPLHCNWYCHKDTDYCIKTHNKLIKGDFLIFTNRIYFTIINFLSSAKGAYKSMNIFILVVGAPLLMWFLAIAVIEKIIF
jgi:hypothetical protein